VAERVSETGEVLGYNTQVTDSEEHCLSCEADSFSTTADIPHILWNPKISSSFPQKPATGTVLSEINPFRSFLSHFSYVHFNNTFPSLSRSRTSFTPI
jgi:hypothetical protein